MRVAIQGYEGSFHVDMEFDSVQKWVHVLDRLQKVAQSVHVYGVYKRGREFVD